VVFESDALDVFTPYGAAAGSNRVRVLQWITHTGIRARIHDYASLANNTPNQVGRHLPSVLAAEVKTRQLARRQYDRVLIHREVSPFSSGRAIEQVAGGSALSAYDFDDALMWSPRSWKDHVWSSSTRM
jgi:hypothetical protein